MIAATHLRKWQWFVVAFWCCTLPAVRAQPSGDETRIAEAIRGGEYSQALQLLGPALRRAPSNAQLWTMQGVAFERQGNKQEALASFTRALKIAPGNIPALQGAVQIEFDAGSPRAIPLLQRLLQLQPDDLTSHGMLAVLEFQQNRCSEAAPHFEKAAALFQSQVDGLHAYAICLVRLKHPEKAASILKRTAELKDGDPPEIRLLASVELMAHRPEAALAALQPLLSPDVHDVETLELASSAFEGLHDTEKAVDALQRAILLQPADADLYVEFANLSASHQSFQVGINVVSDGIALQPRSASLYFSRGMLYAQLSDSIQAVSLCWRRFSPSASTTAAMPHARSMKPTLPSFAASRPAHSPVRSFGSWHLPACSLSRF